MRTLACLILASGAFAGPAVSLAQSTAPVSHEQVSADLIRVEQAGYHVGDGDATTYPAEIQAAEVKLAAEDSHQTADNAAQDNQAADSSAQDNQQATGNAVGGATLSGTSAAGSSMSQQKPAKCSGPASFCNTFFGN